MAESIWKVGFGKYKGRDVEDVPTDYLEWLIGEDWFKKEHNNAYLAVKQELKYREQFGGNGGNEEDEEDNKWNRR